MLHACDNSVKRLYEMRKDGELRKKPLCQEKEPPFMVAR